MDKIKVLELIRRAEGGMKQHFLSLACHMDKELMDIFALGYFDETDAKMLRDHQVVVLPCDICGSIEPLQDILKVMKVASFIRKHKIDVLHVHGFKAALVGRLAARLTGIPVIYTVHNFIMDYYNSPIQKKLIGSIERVLSSRSQRMITVSKALEKEMETLKPSGSIQTIYNGIDVPDRQREKRFGDTFVVGAAARLIPSKGIQFLVEGAMLALETGGKLKVLIAGDGPEKEKLQRWVSERGVEDAFHFLGYCHDLSGFYREIDLLVLPSLSEGLGLTLLEAMAYRVPVLGTRVGGIPELIRDGYNGELMEPGDSKALSDKLLALAADPGRCQSYGENGYGWVRERFQKEDMIRRLERCILKSISRA